MSEHPFPLRTNPDGSPNMNYIDVLRIDPVPHGQQFGVYSFLSPEHIQKDFTLFCQDEYFKSHAETETFKFENMFMGWVSEAYCIDPHELYEGFLKYRDLRLKNENIIGTYSEGFKAFMEKNFNRLDDAFCKEQPFKTTVRSVKFYGAFATKEEADRYMETIPKEAGLELKVAQNGGWMHWDPLGLETTYADERVNELFREKKRNEEKGQALFQQRVQQAKAGSSSSSSAV